MYSLQNAPVMKKARIEQATFPTSMPNVSQTANAAPQQPRRVSWLAHYFAIDTPRFFSIGTLWI